MVFHTVLSAGFTTGPVGPGPRARDPGGAHNEKKEKKERKKEKKKKEIEKKQKKKQKKQNTKGNKEKKIKLDQ